MLGLTYPNPFSYMKYDGYSKFSPGFGPVCSEISRQIYIYPLRVTFRLRLLEYINEHASHFEAGYSERQAATALDNDNGTQHHSTE